MSEHGCLGEEGLFDDLRDVRVPVAVTEPVRLGIPRRGHVEVVLTGHDPDVVALQTHSLAVGRHRQLGLSPELELLTPQVVPQPDLLSDQVTACHVAQR